MDPLDLGHGFKQKQHYVSHGGHMYKHIQHTFAWFQQISHDRHDSALTHMVNRMVQADAALATW